jgi:hypothetical protein
VRPDVREDGCDARTEQKLERLGELPLALGHDNEDVLGTETLDFVDQPLVAGAGAEDDATGQRVVCERLSHDFVCAVSE